jgi:hypothetical protein
MMQIKALLYLHLLIILLLVSGPTQAQQNEDFVEPDFNQVPSDVLAHIKACDQPPLTTAQCASLLINTLAELTPPSDDTPNAEQMDYHRHRGQLAEAAYLVNLTYYRQLPLASQFRQQGVVNQLTQIAMDAYIAADEARKLVMLVRRFDFFREQAYSNQPQLNELVTILQKSLTQLPEHLLHTRFNILVTIAQAQQTLRLTDVSQSSSDCSSRINQQLNLTIKDAEALAQQHQLWPELVQAIMMKTNYAQPLCFFDSQEFAKAPAFTNTSLLASAKIRQQAIDVALAHGLNTQAVTHLLFNAGITTQYAPGHPNNIAAQKAIETAQQAAGDDNTLQLQVTMAALKLALTLDKANTIEQLSQRLNTQLKRLDTNANLPLAWQELVNMGEHLAYRVYKQGQIQEAQAYLHQLSPIVERFGNQKQQELWQVQVAIFSGLDNAELGYKNLLTLYQHWQSLPSGQQNQNAIRRTILHLAYFADQLKATDNRGLWLERYYQYRVELNNKAKAQAGTYTYALALHYALTGQIDKAAPLLAAVQQYGRVNQEQVLFSQRALEYKMVFPQAQFTLNGELLSFDFKPSFELVYLDDRLQQTQQNAVYLMVDKTDKSAAPTLTVGNQMEGSSRIYRDISQLAVSPDGDIAIHCSASGSCIIWQTENGRTLRQVQVGNDYVLWLRIHPDGQSFFTVTGTFNPQVKQWSIDDGRLLANYQAYSSQHIALSQDGSRLVTTDGTHIIVWDTHSHLPILTRSTRFFAPETADSGLLFIANAAGPTHFHLPFTRPRMPSSQTPAADKQDALYQWDIETDELTQVLPWQPHAAFEQAMLNHTPPCYVSCKDAPELIRQLLDSPTLFARSLNSNVALIKNNQGIWVANNHQITARYRIDSLPLQQMQANKDGVWLVAGSPQGQDNQYSLHKWDLTSGRSQQQLTLPTWNSWYYQQDTLWQYLGNRLMRITLVGDGQAERFDLPPWDDGTDPEIQHLWQHQNQLWIVESNGYSGDKAEYRLRSVDLTSFNTLSLAPWSQSTLVNIDTEHNRVLLRNSPDYQQTAEYQWLDIGTGTSISTFELAYDWSHLTPNNTQVQLTPKGYRLIASRTNQVHAYHPDASLAWQWQSLVGNIQQIQLSQDKQSLWVLADANESTYLYQLDSHNGQLLSRKIINSALAQISLTEQDATLVGRSADGLVHWWPRKHSSPLASLMQLHNDGFLVVSPKGFYDSNRPGDIPAVSWVLADAPRRALPLEAFMRDFYQPGLLGRLRAGENISMPTHLANLNREIPQVSIDKIVATSPQSAQVSITVAAQSHQGISSGATDLRVFRNGQLVAYYPNKDGDILDTQQSRTLTFDNIALPAGDEALEFSAYAFNSDGVRSERANQAFTQARQYTMNQSIGFVISLGVNEYQNPAWNLRYAANDAEVMQQNLSQSLSHNGQIDKIVKIPLISAKNSDLRATKTQLEAVLKALTQGTPLPIEGQPSYQADINDVIFITYSGHGYVHDNGQFYFLLEDIGTGAERAINDAVLQHALSSEQLSHWLRPLDVGQMIMIVDACHSAASIASSDFKPGPMGSRGLGQLAYDKAMLFLTASQAEQVAMESASLQHGFLSYALLVEGLAEGKADFAPADTHLTTQEWLHYGVERVPQISRGLSTGAFNTGSRGFAVKRSTPKALPVAQKPYLFNFSHAQPLELSPLTGPVSQ